MLLKYSWILSFIKNSTHLFHDSSFWNRCLYVGSRYYFMMLRLLQFWSCWYFYFMRFVFGYYEIKLFKKILQISCYDIFNFGYVFEKYWYVLETFLNCSSHKLLVTLEKMTKVWISQEQKELLRLNKKTFFIIFEEVSFSEKRKIWQKIVDTGFNNLFKLLISMIRHKR